jgi:transmembrane protein EpsG
MGILWVNLVIVYMFSFISRYLASPDLSRSTFVKPDKSMVLIVISALVLVSGLRRNIGDTYFYKHIYESNNFTWEYSLAQREIGFALLQKLLKVFSTDPQILVFVTALITNVLIVLVLYKYSRFFELSIYVYITSGMYIVSMNGIRQYVAAAIIFTATKYLLDGNWKMYMLIILVASTFHQTALILIPIYFIVRRKAWTGVTFALLFSAIIFTLGFNQLSGLLFSAIEQSDFAHYQNFGEGGANVLRVVVQAAPLVFAYLGRERLRRLFPGSDYIVNMALLGVVFMVVATQNWIFARFSIYFGLYSLILISWVIKLVAEKQQRIVYYGILLFYAVYFYYENAIALGLVYRSDFFGL